MAATLNFEVIIIHWDMVKICHHTKLYQYWSTCFPARFCASFQKLVFGSRWPQNRHFPQKLDIYFVITTFSILHVCVKSKKLPCKNNVNLTFNKHFDKN